MTIESGPSGEVVNHTLPQVTTVNNTAKFPYLKVGEYDVWAMKMQNYISSTDLQCWNVVMKGNHARPTTTDSNGKIVYRDPVSADEYLVLQRESKARSTLISALPDEHMSDFNHMIDAKDIWDAIKAKFGSNEESRKLQKTMLKQAFAEFKMTSEEGLDKCYERMQKMLTQMNSLKIKPEQEEVNMCFLRALPESWRQVSLSLRARGGLDLLTFEDLYSKLKFLESDVRGYARPSHAAFVGSSSTSQNKPAVHGSNSSSSYPSYFPSPQTSSNEHSIKVSKVVDDVVYSLLADHEKDQQLCFDDLDQLNKQDLEEYDLKHQMAMLSIRVRRFEKKAGRKIKFNGRESARFDKQLVKCYKCHQKGHFSRECRAPTSQTEYSTYKAREERNSQPDKKALVSVDGCGVVNWDSIPEDNEVETRSLDVYGMMASMYDESDSEDDVSAEECVPAEVVISADDVVDSAEAVDSADCSVSAGGAQISDQPLAFVGELLWSKVSFSSALLDLDDPDSPWLCHSHEANTKTYDKAKDRGIVDSGCSRSMSGNRDKLEDFVAMDGGEVTFGGGFKITRFSEFVDKKLSSPIMKMNALFLSSEFKFPDLAWFLFTVSKETQTSFTFSLHDFSSQGNITCLLAKASMDESTKWHRRLGHVNFRNMNKLVTGNLVRGLPSKLFQNDHTCVACNKGKQHKASYKRISAVSLIPSPLFIFAYGSLWTGLCAKHQSQDLLDYSNPRTPQQNRVAERKNRTLIEAARTMLADSLLPTSVWALKGSILLLGPTIRIEETMNLNFLENKPNIQGTGQAWYFDLDYLTDSLNYSRSSSTNLSAGTQATASTYAGSQDHDDSDSDDEQDVIIIPSEDTLEKDALTELQRQAQAGMNLSKTFLTINSAGRKSNSAGRSQDDLGGPSLRFPTPSELESSDLHDGSKIYNYPDSGIFTSSSYDDEYTGPDVTNMKSTIDVNPTATTRVHNVHSPSLIIGNVSSPVQTRSQLKEKKQSASAFVSYIQHQRRNNHIDFQLCMFACFLSQMEPASVDQALNDPDWVEAMQEEMQQFKNQQVWVLVELPKGKRELGRDEKKRLDHLKQDLSRESQWSSGGSPGVMKGNHARPTTTDSNGKIVYRDPVSADEYLVLQRESKARSTLISALPDEHMSDFNHMIDAKDIWDAIKAKGGLDLLTFEDLYSKLKFLESDVRGYARPSHAAFVGSSSTSQIQITRWVWVGDDVVSVFLSDHEKGSTALFLDDLDQFKQYKIGEYDLKASDGYAFYRVCRYGCGVVNWDNIQKDKKWRTDLWMVYGMMANMYDEQFPNLCLGKQLPTSMLLMIIDDVNGIMGKTDLVLTYHSPKDSPHLFLDGVLEPKRLDKGRGSRNNDSKRKTPTDVSADRSNPISADTPISAEFPNFCVRVSPFVLILTILLKHPFLLVMLFQQDVHEMVDPRPLMSNLFLILKGHYIDYLLIMDIFNAYLNYLNSFYGESVYSPSAYWTWTDPGFATHMRSHSNRKSSSNYWY
ncbi:ribonuclease H-like domain-containing protein [Tanacetum coccineum]